MDQAANPLSGTANPGLPEGVRRVSQWLERHGHLGGPVLLDSAARTAQQAADALSVTLGQIAKSIVFRRLPEHSAVLVIASGDRRVDEAKVARRICEGSQVLARADAEFVKQSTGYSIGGVPPVAHLGAPIVLVDRELARFAEIWAAAGHPHAVFRLTPDDLCRLTGQAYTDVVLEPVT